MTSNLTRFRVKWYLGEVKIDDVIASYIYPPDEHID